MRLTVVRVLFATIVLTLGITACGGTDNTTVAGDGNATGAVGQPTSATGNQLTSTVSSDTTAQVAALATTTALTQLTQGQILALKPNELGQVPILEYHSFGDVAEQFIRTPDQFRSDLQWLYDHNFYVINLHDFLADTINVPAGKRPVVFTFDDSPASQFRLVPLQDGQFAIDPNCAIGILEAFFGAHPDFGRGGHFAVLPDKLFDWTPTLAEPDQSPFSQMKMEWLRDHGYEIGNHTRDHANLSVISDEDIMYQLAEANIMIHQVLPDVPIEVITLPYGMYPVGPTGGGDDTLFRGFDYNGQRFTFAAALMVGANPAVVPHSTEFDPYAIARIQAFDEELDKWFGVFESDPGILYVSDGDLTVVTVPTDLHPYLVGTLDETKLNGRQVVRY